MQSYCYLSRGEAGFCEKAEPSIVGEKDAIVRVTLSSICTSDLHIIRGSVPRAVKGVTLGHEAVGIVERVGGGVKSVASGDRVAINVETFCGECYFCKHGWVNNCTDKDGGWALGCRIDGMQAPLVRVPHADTGLTKIPANVTDRQALFVGDILATGYWAADISEIEKGDNVLVLGGGPAGVCCALCAQIAGGEVLLCEKNEGRGEFLRKNFPTIKVVEPKEAERLCAAMPRGGADRVIEAAGGEDTFQAAWKAARPNAIVTVVAMYDKAQSLPLPDMYGKNLTFKTGGVDGNKCAEILALIAEGRLDTTPLITHTFPFKELDKAYALFAERRDGVMKVAITYGEEK